MFSDSIASVNKFCALGPSLSADLITCVPSPYQWATRPSARNNSSISPSGAPYPLCRVLPMKEVANLSAFLTASSPSTRVKADRAMGAPALAATRVASTISSTGLVAKLTPLVTAAGARTKRVRGASMRGSNRREIARFCAPRTQPSALLPKKVSRTSSSEMRPSLLQGLKYRAPWDKDSHTPMPVERP